MPITAVITVSATSYQRMLSPTNRIIGEYANTNGMMNAAIASRVAVRPVFIGLPCAIAEPAYAASATGGVISATIPK